jgi:transcription termination/antitermination protein NusA
MRIKYDFALMKIISLFTSVTHADVKDCFEDRGGFTFVVPAGQAGKAIGKAGANIKKLELKLKKKVRVVEFNPDKMQCIQNFIKPLNVDEVEEREDGVIVLKSRDTHIKSLLIGRNAVNLRALEENVRRYFEVKEIKVE